jgi:saccharopine dehydrogenase-like NADP-dependent oxidoreductase
MKKVLVLGAGKIGSSISKLLIETNEYHITLADISKESLDRVPNHANMINVKYDINESKEDIFKDKDAVISALSYHYGKSVAEKALDSGASYFDLTEDVATTKAIQKISKKAKDGQIFMPQCGLAPGFVGIVGNYLANQFDTLDTLLMRVGALPMYPTNMLKYNLTWSTDGLINEYCNPCEAIHEGEFVEALPLEGLEHFSVDGLRYEAFNTSGGLGTLCETWKGKARNLNYKTVRYMGHRDLASFLLFELKFNKKQELLKDIFESAIPATTQDVVIVFCTATGMKDGRYIQITDARKIYHDDVHSEPWSAIQITTAAGVCAVFDLHMNNKLPKKGFVSQEEVKLGDFLKNRFGNYYEISKHKNVKQVDVFLEDK